MADFDNEVMQALDQAVRNIQASMEQMVADMLPRLVQTAVVNAVNEYAAVRESGEAERFKAHMAHLYPILDQLGHRPQSDDKPGTSEHPEVAMLIPGAEAGQEVVAGWSQYLPFGDKDGQALVWNKEDESWDPGEVAGGGYDGEFALYLAENEQGQTALHMKGGTVRYGNALIDIDPAVFSSAQDLHVYLTCVHTKDPAVRVFTSFAALGSSVFSGGYVKIGSWNKNKGEIVQDYVGGSGLFFHPIPDASTHGQILKWNNAAKRWVTGWLTAIE